jgi:hypothetical protein
MMLDAPAVRGQPRLYLQLEGGALLALSTALYAWGGAPWWIYAVFFFAPDISFLAYFVGPRTGAMVYNAMHTSLAPAILVALAAAAEYLPLATVGAAIWAAHIGYDRLLGYGLKYPAGYKLTHLGELWCRPTMVGGCRGGRRPTQDRADAWRKGRQSYRSGMDLPWKLVGKNPELVNHRHSGKQVAILGLVHQCRRYLAVEVRIAPGLVLERIEDGERRRPFLNRKPADRAWLGVHQG